MNEPRKLGDLVSGVQAGFWGADAPRTGAVPVRVIRNGDAASAQSLIDEQLPLRWVSPSERNRALVVPSDVVLVSSGEVGKVSRLAQESDELTIASNFVRRVRPAPGIDAAWLYHLMDSDDALRAARRSSGGTTLQNLSWSSYRNWIVQCPSKISQRRAADVLDTVDRKIALSQRLLDKLGSAKHGLLVELLTRGRSADGGMRSGPEARSTVIGPLPEEWEVRPLSDLLGSTDPAMRSGPFGSALLKRELVESGIPLLGIDNVHVDRFDRDYKRFVTPSKARELARYRVFPDDVMITIMGTVGRACLVPHDIGHALSSKHVWTMTFDRTVYLPYLVMTQLNHAPWVRCQLRRDEQGGIMSAIRSETLRSVKLPVPPISEQERIAAVLHATDRRINAEAETLRQLVGLKRGLSADLTSGRVQIPIGRTQ
jgi:type I restriction enzyme S subunit